jgi:archaellum component FlaD/FlaE
VALPGDAHVYEASESGSSASDEEDSSSTGESESSSSSDDESSDEDEEKAGAVEDDGAVTHTAGAVDVPGLDDDGHADAAESSALPSESQSSQSAAVHLAKKARIDDAPT